MPIGGCLKSTDRSPHDRGTDGEDGAEDSARRVGCRNHLVPFAGVALLWFVGVLSNKRGPYLRLEKGGGVHSRLRVVAAEQWR
jgi:hypothetical protein